MTILLIIIIYICIYRLLSVILSYEQIYSESVINVSEFTDNQSGNKLSLLSSLSLIYPN